MITWYHVYYEIHDEVSNNDKVHNSFIKVISVNMYSGYNYNHVRFKFFFQIAF